jgi:hypothetical protein
MLLILLAWALSASAGQSPAPATPIDVSAVRVGAAAVVTQLDLGKLKGEPRQIGWSADRSQLYIQTAEGDGRSAPKLHHYVVAATGGEPKGVDAAPDWAEAFWTFKSDRSAPGLVSLMIDVEQKMETMKVGTGQAGALDREANPVGGNLGNVETIAKGNDQNQKQQVVRFKLLGETVSEFVNARPVPGLMFGWGPARSGAIAFVEGDGGRLMLLDQQKHKQAVAGVKDALLPAWSIDGSRLAWLQRSGRKKYALMTAPIAW